MKSAERSIKVPIPKTAPPQRVALKIQRRCYGRDALTEIGIHHYLRRDHGPSPDLIGFHEAFFHDGHVCTAYELHGRSLDTFVDRGPLPLDEVRAITRQLLGGLVRMHEYGFAHTDVKPQNILHRRTPRPRARLSDLGNADNILRQGSNRCTRDYTPPEVLLGNPLDPRLDLWSLACTVFELATGHVLFDPYKATRRKYKEFNQELPETAYDPSVAADAAAEAAEQYRPGHILSGKYRLESKLGSGKFATVWRATVLNSTPLDGTYDTLSARCKEIEDATPTDTPSTADPARAWRKARGAQDLHDLVLNYEHLVLIQDLLGPPPREWAASGNYASAYCSPDGRLKHDPAPANPVTLETLLRRRKLRATDARNLAAFLMPMLTWKPTDRPAAFSTLQHAWLLGEDQVAKRISKSFPAYSNMQRSLDDPSRQAAHYGVQPVGMM